METFDRKQTNSIGLWWHADSCKFSSGSINLSKLKQFKGTVRFTVKKNKYFNGGENSRPNYLMWIVDSKSENTTDIEIEECEEEVEDSKYILTEEELQTLIDLVACDVGGDSEYGNNIVSDYFNTETKRLRRY